MEGGSQSWVPGPSVAQEQEVLAQPESLGETMNWTVAQFAAVILKL